MGYPSLLYKSEPKLKPMSISVFEDLQLLNFIPKSVAKTVRIPCEAENILPRQELFKSLESDNARRKFTELYFVSEELDELNGIYETSRIDEERAAIFITLIEAERRFAKIASECGFGDRISARFAAAFAAELEDPVRAEMYCRLDVLYPELCSVLGFSLKTHGQEIRLSKDGAETYLERIISCARTLGLDEPKLREAEKRRISPDIIAAKASKHPELFSKLVKFMRDFENLWSVSVTYYLKELRFYLVMLDFFDRIKGAGIPLTYPELTDGREISVKNCYDVSLLAKNQTNIVPNDIDFSVEEPFYYLTGANGGGKTTYLRTVGIAAVLYLNGCPVPCDEAKFGVLSSVFTHFPRDERFDGSGRFVEENGRVQKILENMDQYSLVLLNETYSTTNEENAVMMTEKLANEIYGKNIFGLYITHQHSLSESKIPYLNVLIDKNDSNRRTFRIAKQKSTGGSFARDILERYRLTAEALAERFGELSKNSEGEENK